MAAKSKAKATTPSFIVANHRFTPGITVGFYPAHTVEAQRIRNAAPIPNPTEVAKVASDGTLKVHGLKPGPWVAAAEQDDTWRYLSITVV